MISPLNRRLFLAGAAAVIVAGPAFANIWDQVKAEGLLTPAESETDS